ncbi:tRNA dihydrouridine(20/20a) synthase DusA [Marinospirillum alkaliphilum]|uniref:tRNA-dihydrouridine(20/20a) synthase n=1 Tax=Marinospirillum alkaliphilum DSM 21637 TaxID=1122209 RepID=A0A1K1TZE0_9GAMM|nr:tRNA dihydrouridine(20/20a) synthase DusA [Marinospirillum alkaliphilum]SFX05926.1 tRNA-U16,U17-dihydrouridine synthase [Marinospirillum alkaliphilum DSM 21637]
MPDNAWGGKPYPVFSVAPMLDVTDRHFRYFLRLLSRHTLLYTEMVTTGAILHGKDPQRFLDFSAEEHPLALQLGGSNPDELARCTELATQWGYDEINLNVGCPSDRVQNNLIGACLMAHPQRVAECLQAMQAATPLPVTVKCRIGIDEQDEDADLEAFIEAQQQAGCRIFILHARKAWLQGLSPKENREIPPLNYGRVHRLKQQHPELVIGINGGLETLDACKEQLQQVDSVMLGRAIWNNPWLVAEVDQQLMGDPATGLTRHQAIRDYLPYVEQRLQAGDRLNPMIRPLLGLFQGVPGARRFRRLLSERAHLAGEGPELLEQALALVPEQQPAAS